MTLLLQYWSCCKNILGRSLKLCLVPMYKIWTYLSIICMWCNEFKIYTYTCIEWDEDKMDWVHLWFPTSHLCLVSYPKISKYLMKICTFPIYIPHIYKNPSLQPSTSPNTMVHGIWAQNSNENSVPKFQNDWMIITEDRSIIPHLIAELHR